MLTGTDYIWVHRICLLVQTVFEYVEYGVKCVDDGNDAEDEGGSRFVSGFFVFPAPDDGIQNAGDDAEESDARRDVQVNHQESILSGICLR